MKANPTASPIACSRFAVQGLAMVGLSVLAGCARIPSPPPATAPLEGRRAAPVLPAPVRSASDWRDAPITAGLWSWSRAGTRSIASFRETGGQVLATLSCEAPGSEVRLARAGQANAAVVMALTTTAGSHPLVSLPAISPPGWVVASLRNGDPVLDQIAFSRGRFAVDVAGLPSLYLPSWPEISRVIEDCR